MTDLEQYRDFIRDKHIWRFIFNKDRPDLNNAQSFYRYMNNVINLTFMYVVACIREIYNTVDDFEEIEQAFNPNSRRALKNIDRIHKDLDITNELINYILLDIQFDLSLGTESCLKPYIPGISETFRVLDYTPRIMHWMKTSKPEANVNVDTLAALFENLLTALPFLGFTSLDGSENSVCFICQTGFKKKTFYLDYTLYIQDCGREYYRYYFLERVVIKDRMLMLVYSTTDYADKLEFVYYEKDKPAPQTDCNDDNIVLIESDKDEIESIINIITGCDTGSIFSLPEEQHDGIRNIFTVNYKYIKNLSLSISDVLGRNDKTLIREKLLEQYGVSLKDISDLDSVIIMKIIELTPRVVLFDLFLIDNSAFYAIIRNLFSRFNCKISFKYVDFSKRPENFSELDRHIKRSVRTHKNNSLSVEIADIEANYIISMLLAKSKETEERVERIIDDINLINQNEDLEIAQKLLANLLVKMYCFYCGILAYGKEKLDYDARCYNSISTTEEIKEAQLVLTTAFMDAANNAFIKTFQNFDKTNTTSYLKYAITSILSLIKSVKNNVEKIKALRCVIGKNEILDLNELGLNTSLLDMDTSCQRIQIVRLMEYLMTGSFEKNENQGDFNSAIFPMIGKYVSNIESNDQYRIANFSIRLDVNANGKVDFMKIVNILSEFNYIIDDYYYCLPNIGRSNFEWWIDPLIINADAFDDIFRKEA